jgi:hypothetical protein
MSHKNLSDPAPVRGEKSADLERLEDAERRRRIIADAAHKYGPDGPLYREQGERMKERWRREGRKAYADRILVEQGRVVRNNRRGTQVPTEAERKAEDAIAARERYAQRIRGGEDREVRHYAARVDTSKMSREELTLHRREQARRRKEEQRKRKKA